MHSKEYGKLKHIRAGNINASVWIGMPSVLDCLECVEWKIQKAVLRLKTGNFVGLRWKEIVYEKFVYAGLSIITWLFW